MNAPPEGLVPPGGNSTRGAFDIIPVPARDSGDDDPNTGIVRMGRIPD